MPKIAIAIPDSEELVYPLRRDAEEAVIKIGRSPECDIVIPIASVSGFHATLTNAPYGYVLRDAGSTNGLIVGGVREETIVLKPGIRVLIGEATLTCQPDSEDEGWTGEAPDDVEAGAAVGQVADGHGDTPLDAIEREVEEELTPPDLAPLEYDGSEDEDDDDEVKTVRVTSKGYYLVIVVYTIFIFGLAFVAGMIYKHYDATGEILPYKWLGLDSPKEKALRDLEAQRRANSSN